MVTVNLSTPLTVKDVRRLKAGDTVFISGTIYTARDKAHRRMLDCGKSPVKLAGEVLFHCGPLVKKGKLGWEVVGLGPTTSSRVNKYTPELIEKLKPNAIIGKGGMDGKCIKAFKEYGTVYLAMTGGCAAIAARSVTKVLDVAWADLGLAEAVWSLEVEKLGPLTVAIDCQGESLYQRRSL